MNRLTESVLWISDDRKGKDKKKRKNKNKRKTGFECWHCKKAGHVCIRCQSWLKDTDENREYVIEYFDSEKLKTGPLLTSRAKGNLSPDRA